MSRKTAEADNLRGMAETFYEWMRFTNYSGSTIKNRRVYLSYFFDWCEDRDLRTPQEINKPIIEADGCVVFLCPSQSNDHDP